MGYPDPDDYYGGGGGRGGGPAAESWRAAPAPPAAERTRAMDRAPAYDRPAAADRGGAAARRFILKMRGIPFSTTEYDVYEVRGRVVFLESWT